MTPDRLKDLLRNLPTPHAGQARERAVAEARAEIAARGADADAARGVDADAARGPTIGAARGRTGPARGWRPRLPSLAAAVLLVLVALLTPPGRAASAWVGELVGIGDVGGPPTQEKRGFAESGSAVVIDNGVGPDGNRYEWVAYECLVDLHEEGLDTRFAGIGVSFEWPSVKGYHGGGDCEELAGRPRSGAFGSNGVHILPSQQKGVAEPDLMVSGTTGPEVHRVSVIYRDGDGEKHELPVDFARVEGKLREVARRPEALGTFAAFVPGEWAARDEIESRLDLRALMGTGKLKLGPIGRREREQAQQAFKTCDPLQPDLASVDPRDEKAARRALQPLRECHERHMPPSPFEYVAYDENGRELERMSEPLIIAAVRAPETIEAEGHEQPGDKRSRRPTEIKEDVAVLLEGRSPDGALYEVFVQPTKYGSCMTMWWPYVAAAGGGGSCGPDGLPPDTAFGRRNPEEVFAKPYGFLTDTPQATTHRILSGFARPNVSRLEVVYSDLDGNRHDAPVKLAQVSGSKLERFEADGPFGYWVAFLPRSAGRRPPVDVIAYGEDGERVGRHRHQE